MDIKKYETAKRYLFQVLDLLTKYGADFDDWADSQTWSVETCRAAFMNDFIPRENKPYRKNIMEEILPEFQRAM